MRYDQTHTYVSKIKAICALIGKRETVFAFSLCLLPNCSLFLGHSLEALDCSHGRALQVKRQITL